MFDWIMSKKRTRSRKAQRKIKGGDGASDYGVKVWGYDQVAGPHQGNVIQVKQTGGAFANAAPDVPNMDMGQQQNMALSMQSASINQMTSNTPPAYVQSQSVTPQKGGKRRRRTKRVRGSKRKYGHTVRNGRRTKTIY